jgi:hypothetical protein
MKRVATIGLISLFSIIICQAQEDKKPKTFEFSGYLKDMPSFYAFQNELPISATETMKYTWYNLIHNRLNFKYIPINKENSNLNFNLSVRNRFLVGDLTKRIPQYGDVLSVDNGLTDLSWTYLNKGGFVLNTTLDRLYIDYSYKNFQFKIGRQRINWGIGLVWNPNDIFNAFSYIDFDYEERHGSDAVAVTWYSSATSSLEAVAKMDKDQSDSTYKYSIAARYLFNVNNYDLQFITGKSDNDLMGGFGWSGGIKNVSFRGEISVFVPVLQRDINKQTAVCATVEADYTFSNSLYLHGAFLFNSSGKIKNSEAMNLLALQNDLSAKKLSFGMFECFANISYPINPVLSISLATMFNPADLSAYISPNFTISLKDNLDLLICSQLLLGETNTEYASMGNTYAVFARLKWSF